MKTMQRGKLRLIQIAVLAALSLFAVVSPVAADTSSDFTCKITDRGDGKVDVTWTEKTVTGEYHVRENGQYKTTIAGQAYEGTKGSSYEIVSWVRGTKFTADCGSTDPVDPPVNNDLTCTITSAAKISWNAVGNDGQIYQILEDTKWKTKTTSLSYQGTLGKSYSIVAYSGGKKLTADCGSTDPVDPPVNNDLTCTITSAAKISWNAVGNDGQRYQILEDTKWKTSTADLSYQGTLGKSYSIVAYSGGKKLTADCGSTTPPPVADDLVCTAQTQGGNVVLTWNNVNPDSGRYQILENNSWLASTGALTYTAPGGVTYKIRAVINGKTQTAECTGANPPAPVDFACTGTVVGNNAVLTWNNVNPDNGNYVVKADGTTVKTTSALTYTSTAGKSYKVTTVVNGTTYTADCGDTPLPVVPAACARISGETSIDEGRYGSYQIFLNKPALTDRTFTVATQDGSAKRVGNEPGIDNQKIMWGGYYTTIGLFWENKIYDRFPTTSGNWVHSDEPMIGPKDATWDYSLQANGQTLNSNQTTVTVRAGNTGSTHFYIKAWNERVSVDLNAYSAGYNEGIENLSLYVAGTNCNLGVNIIDKTSYEVFSPIILDLDGDGIETTSIEDSDATFDLLGNGTQVRSGWTTDALLAHDANNDGLISSSNELFGGANIGDGYGKLATFDSNGDGVVSAADDRFSELTVWIDVNQNRITDDGELQTLTEAGVTSITVANTWDGSYQNGNVLGETSSATLANGDVVAAVDAYFQYDDK